MPQSDGLYSRYVRMLVSYRENPRTLLLVLVIYNVLNLADLVLTYRSLLLGANPVPRVLEICLCMCFGNGALRFGDMLVHVFW